MKTCPNCNVQLDDAATFCANCVALLFWTIIVPVAYGVMSCIFLVLRVICFFQICSGKAKEPAIIRSLGFLK